MAMEYASSSGPQPQQLHPSHPGASDPVRTQVLRGVHRIRRAGHRSVSVFDSWRIGCPPPMGRPPMSVGPEPTLPPLWTPRAGRGHNAGERVTIHGVRREGSMAADQQGGALKPVTPARVAEELKNLSSQRKEGKLAPDEYEHRFSRMITELRERRIDGTRADILGTLTPLKDQGVISLADWQRLTRQLGLA